MDALTDNALANMPGPQFLLLYALLAGAAVLAVVFVGMGGSDGTPPALAPRPDPYEIAFLRDGYGGVAWLAIYALKRMGFIEMTAKGELKPLPRDGRPGHRCEARVLDAIGAGCEASAIAAASAAGKTLQDVFAASLARLQGQGLARDEAMRRRVVHVAVGAAILMTAVATYKDAVAETHGHHNVGFLIAEWGLTLVALLILGVRFAAPGATARGRAYLDRVKLAYDSTRLDAASEAADRMALLTVAAVGFSVLAGSPDAAFAQQARKTGSSGSCSGGGSSCSGGGGCGGGGCGGCGGS